MVDAGTAHSDRHPVGARAAAWDALRVTARRALEALAVEKMAGVIVCDLIRDVQCLFNPRVPTRICPYATVKA